MKFCSVLVLPVIVILSGCKFLPLMTKDETIKAVIGKWNHEDINKSDVKAIVFTSQKNARGDSVYIMQYKKIDNKGNRADTGAWRYVGVGKIEIWNDYWNFNAKKLAIPFNMIDRSKMLMLNDDLYAKDK
jgi:hypothetical protein